MERGAFGFELTDLALSKFPRASVIKIGHYKDVFNRPGQDFQIQKSSMKLILAKKTEPFLYPASDMVQEFDTPNVYYNTPILNCLYNCDYCFLQGMYRSAHYLLFVNFEDFKREIEEILAQSREGGVYFFSGYDCDSLALDSVTDFVREFVPFFAERPKGILELRTKSSNVDSLLELEAIPNCVVAYSLSPDAVARALEHKAPPLRQRLASIGKLASAGWPIGLRFDPLIYNENFNEMYRELF